MPRLPRYFVPGFPLHVIQRGNDRAATFRSPEDFAFYRECLAFATRRHGVSVHAYVLMTNHVHLLATPSAAASLPKAMQSIGRIYVRYFNERYRRTGTLWEGRYRATLIDDDRYLFTCMRYIELNPVRAALVDEPSRYPWSSYGANALDRKDELVAPHAVFRSLGASTGERRAAYRAMFALGVAGSDIDAIRDATQHAWALGDAQFCARISKLGRRAHRVGRSTVSRRKAPDDPKSTLTLVDDKAL